MATRGLLRDSALGAHLHHQRSARRDRLIDALINQIATLPGVRRVLRRRIGGRLEQVAVSFIDGGSRTVQLPGYPTSGHTVTLFEPALIADDLQRWLASSSL